MDRDKFYQFLVWNVMPKRLIYWAIVRAGVYATTGRYSSSELATITLPEFLGRWMSQNTSKDEDLKNFYKSMSKSKGGYWQGGAGG